MLVKITAMEKRLQFYFLHSAITALFCILSNFNLVQIYFLDLKMLHGHHNPEILPLWVTPLERIPSRVAQGLGEVTTIF